jgi:hypothetical protein
MITECSYLLNSEIFLSPGIWISFFLRPKKPMLLCSHIPPEGKAADRGPVDHRPSGPGSSPPEAGKGKEQA